MHINFVIAIVEISFSKLQRGRSECHWASMGVADYWVFFFISVYRQLPIVWLMQSVELTSVVSNMTDHSLSARGSVPPQTFLVQPCTPPLVRIIHLANRYKKNPISIVKLLNASKYIWLIKFWLFYVHLCCLEKKKY